ncbi:TPA: RND transporter, partial [Candidatus Bipolaricaulota bacterium]|nr:RND transporter [Candidatus Bipolaricaulota bacterium]
MKRRLVTFSLDHPVLIVLLTLALVAFSAGLGVYRGIRDNWDVVDTDPENMLSEQEAVRIFHNATKKEFSLHDIIVLGIANERDPDGVFNPGTLSAILSLTEFIKGLDGVITYDVIAPSEVDKIEHLGPGVISLTRLMKEAPADRVEAARIRDDAKRDPLLYGTLLSEDAKAICIYVPIREKKISHEIASKIRQKARDLGMREMDYRSLAEGAGGRLVIEGDAFGITGLPVAEDTFGTEMFKQMAISAPLAMLVIFILMMLFFRKFVLVLSPMIVAMVSMICTMGFLVGFGYTVHIMSSMIPIFLMPIAVVDSVHILSEFFDRYRKFHDARKTVLAVMDELFVPMLYTSLTSAAGFASLALTPIPPVQVFGLFVAFGIMLAWILTVTLIPAYIMFIPRSRLETYGAAHDEKGEHRATLLTRGLQTLGTMTVRRAKPILGLTLAVIALSAYGVSLIRVND